MSGGKRGRPAKVKLPDGYELTQTEMGQWAVWLNGSIRNVFQSKGRAEEYIRAVSGDNKKGR